MLFQALSSSKMLARGQADSHAGLAVGWRGSAPAARLGAGTAIWLWLVYATANSVTSGLCFRLMLTYLGSSGHTLQKPLMTS